jgi:hypothetical protein
MNSDHPPFTTEIAMPNVITIGREHIPVEQIAYVESFELPANGQFKPDKSYKGRFCNSLRRGKMLKKFG